MMNKLGYIISSMLAKFGYTKTRKELPKDFEEAFIGIYEKCAPFTMTSPERMYALHKSIIYIEKNGIPGDIVECGVWRGGSSMVSALTLEKLGSVERKLYLYDTFKGMTKPGGKDKEDELKKWQAKEHGIFNEWNYAPLDEVRKNMLSTAYPKENMVFVEGPVEKTIPIFLPKEIAVLRLDTDWFESTYHELTNLFPKLVKGGVLIVDDYGSKQGARHAVDRYFEENGKNPYLVRIDGTCRIMIKG